MSEEILTENNGVQEDILTDITDDNLPEDMYLEYENGKGDDEE